MNLPEARSVLEQNFTINWDSRTPVQTSNLKYKPVTGQPWVRFSVIETRSFNAEVGTTGSHVRKRHIGIVYIEIFRPAYRGDDFTSLATDAGRILEFKTINKEITIDASFIQDVGVITGGAWYLETATMTYRFDEIIPQG